jgi:ABC-2 type transport system permease protein
VDVVYWEWLKKSYRQQAQYRLAHFINNLGSAIFGFMYIAIWHGVLLGKEHSSPFSIQDMTHYMAFSQCLIWLTLFLTPGLGIQDSMRTGLIGIEMARPASFYLSYISREMGKIVYNLCYRSLPLGLIFYVFAGFHFPGNMTQWLSAFVSISLAVALSLNLFYMVGITACWTVEIRWAHLTLTTLLVGLGGSMIPLRFLPAFLAHLTPYLPFASVNYYPTIIYLGKITTGLLGIFSLQTIWVLVFVLINLGLTSWARKKLEIQGG